MRPFMGGGEMIVEVTEDLVTYNEPPHRFEAGTPPIVQAIGLGAALDYMDGIGRARIAAHERIWQPMPRSGCGRQFAADHRQCAGQGRHLLFELQAFMPMMSRR